MEYTTLRMGAFGPQVREVQRMLAHLGYSPGTIDGKFGVRTQRAVIAFQSASELPIDGVVAANTWMALERRAGGIRQEETRPLPPPLPEPPMEAMPEPPVAEPVPLPAEEAVCEGAACPPIPIAPLMDWSPIPSAPIRVAAEVLAPQMEAAEEVSAPQAEEIAEVIAPQEVSAAEEASAPHVEMIVAVGRPWTKVETE